MKSIRLLVTMMAAAGACACSDGAATNDSSGQGEDAITASAESNAVSSKPLKKNYGGLFVCTEANREQFALPQFWLKVAWSDLEPKEGQPNWSKITDYLDAHPGVTVRLHIMGGPTAPTWLAKDSGAFVEVYNDRDSKPGQVGRYWEPNYKAHFAAFVKLLGEKFDGDPRIASVNNFGNSLIYDEPWIMGGDPGTAARLFDAGLNMKTDLAAQEDAIAALIAAFPTTVVEFPGHSDWGYPKDSTGEVVHDWAGGRAIFNSFHSKYGKHIIFTDYGLGPNEGVDAEPLATAAHYYGWMHQLANEGYPIGFQLTLGPPNVQKTEAEMVNAVQQGIDMGASWVEHSDVSLLETQAEVDKDNAALKRNVP